MVAVHTDEDGAIGCSSGKNAGQPHIPRGRTRIDRWHGFMVDRMSWLQPSPYKNSCRKTSQGYASYNVELNKFTKFEMVSIGKRKGKTQNNGRKNSPDSGYIGFYFTLAKDMRSERIAPAFVDVYNADWIVQT